MTQPHNRIHQSKRQMILNNFLGGIAWGLGVTVGLSIILALLGILMNAIGFVPVVGDFVIQVTEYVEQADPGLR